MLSAISGVAVAANVAAARRAAVAASVFDPATVPSVQLPTAARPEPSVFFVPPLKPPPPEPTANVTVTLSTGLPNWSVTRSVGRTGTAVFTVTVGVSPAVLLGAAGAPGVAVALKVRGVTPVTWARSVFAPVAVPRVQLVTRALPAASVATPVTGLTEPPPPVTLNVTAAPGTG